jgi:PAS domain S-box-containing protein
MTYRTAPRPLQSQMRLKEARDLRSRLRDAEEMLRAFSGGEVDAIVRPGSSGNQVYTLKGADHVYRMMVETMSEGAITLSPEGVILYANRRFAELLLTDLGEIMGRRIQEFVDPATEAEIGGWLQGRQDVTLRHSIELKRSTGDSIAAYVAIRRLQVDGVLCSIAIISDLTELRRAEAHLRVADEQFRRAIEAAPSGLLLINPANSIVLVNAQIESLFGYPRAELLGRQIDMLLPARRREDRRPVRTSPGSEPYPTDAHGDRYGIRKDGSSVPIEIAFTPFDTSQGELILVSIIDLSSRREVDRLRTEFVSMVSHELRTPLTAICGSLGLLTSGAMGALPEHTAAMVRIAQRNSARLERIINDILDIGTLEAGTTSIKMSSVPLGDLIRQSVEVSAGYAQKCQVRFLTESSCPDAAVMVDPHRLVQVIANILSNAAKFSPPGADVVIRVLPGSTVMRIEVQDSGPGIPESFQSRVFEKFAQADSTSNRRHDGAGLGLSIARKLINAMGGSIGFSSVADQGTIFYLEVPRADPATPAAAAL